MKPALKKLFKRLSRSTYLIIFVISTLIAGFFLGIHIATALFIAYVYALMTFSADVAHVLELPEALSALDKHGKLNIDEDVGTLEGYKHTVELAIYNYMSKND